MGFIHLSTFVFEIIWILMRYSIGETTHLSRQIAGLNLLDDCPKYHVAYQFWNTQNKGYQPSKPVVNTTFTMMYSKSQGQFQNVVSNIMK